MRSCFAVADQPAEGALAPLVVGGGHAYAKLSTILPPRGLFTDSISRAASKRKLVWRRIGGSGVLKSMGKL